MHPQPGHTSSLLEIDILVIRIFFNKAVIIINQIFESNYKEYKAKSQSITDFKVFLNDKKMKMNHSEKQKKGMKMKGMSISNVKPTWVIHHPINKTLYIAGNGSDEIIEIDSENWKISKRIKAQKGPYNVEVTPNGRFLVATLKSIGSTAIWLSLIHI